MRKPDSTEAYHNLWESTVGAATGFFYALKTEKKIRQVFIAMAVAVVICVIGDVGYFQILMVIFSWVLALICEMFNTAIEKALDYSCDKEFHPLVRQGKDYAGACTFVALVFAVSLSLIVLWGRHVEKKVPRERTFEVSNLSSVKMRYN